MMKVKKLIHFACPLIGIVTPCFSAPEPPASENPIYQRIQPAPEEPTLRMEDYWVWGSSVIKDEEGSYHMYASRWPKEYPFHPGWMVASEIVHAVSDTPEGPYEFQSVALPARGAQYWDGRATHNPSVTKHKDTYVLFYTGITHPFAELDDPGSLDLESHYTTLARSNKRIGIATSKSPYGPWERRDAPVLDTQPDTFYSFLTSNPSPWINEDGSVVLIFKSRAYGRDRFPFQSSMMIGAAKAPQFEGPYTVVGDEPVLGEHKGGVVEDPFLWRDEKGYHMLAKDMRGRISGRAHDGVLLHSEDAVTWKPNENPLAYSKTVTFRNGNVQTLGQLERVFGLIENGRITHLFFATMDGPGGFHRGQDSWNMVIPLE